MPLIRMAPSKTKHNSAAFFPKILPPPSVIFIPEELGPPLPPVFVRGKDTMNFNHYSIGPTPTILWVNQTTYIPLYRNPKTSPDKFSKSVAALINEKA